MAVNGRTSPSVFTTAHYTRGLDYDRCVALQPGCRDNRGSEVNFHYTSPISDAGDSRPCCGARATNPSLIPATSRILCTFTPFPPCGAHSKIHSPFHLPSFAIVRAVKFRLKSALHPHRASSYCHFSGGDKAGLRYIASFVSRLWFPPMEVLL
ncbi:hypothetical protein AAFF_G00235910 [Aldrovandia affinis]|uniref:Uncharacterized protein n=1 Tax=Aldrovandia affinis TaxID=143900 RepID=A0AAD7WUD4_9TELE|nr:hypothetical protein AAFF_G00235910 [Aldrovandia affinis]